MPDITASLFAHIENDAHLSGTYGLEGNQFANTTQYLKQFLEHLKASGGDFPPEYTKILESTNYLVETEKKIDAIGSSPDHKKELNTLSQKIAEDILNLPMGEPLSLPGGWKNSEGGHAMMYEFVRTAEGYRFNVINAGAGLQYHAKKSSREKELYNPVKSWSFPEPTTPAAKKELSQFIERLIKIKLPPKMQYRAASDKLLYENVLPSISYIAGSEIAADDIPAHGYTAGQLGGTCTERCIHQKLKINSPSAEFYERFIFKHKLYALDQYSKACLTGKQPFTLAVQEQINLAIENNLKIVNTPGLFNQAEIDRYYGELKSTQKSVNSVKLKAKEKPPATKKPPAALSVKDISQPASRLSYNQPAYNKEPFFKIELDKGGKLLENLAETITKIEQVNDPATQYYYLEQLILALPINASEGLDSISYQSVHAQEQYSEFAKHLDTIQNLLHKLQNGWLKGIQTPSLSHLVLSVMSLQIDTQFQISKKQNLPSFMPFANVVIDSLIGNCERNPFWATNNPAHDQRFKQLQVRFRGANHQNDSDYFNYFIHLLNTEQGLNTELRKDYYSNYGDVHTEIHSEIRGKGLESLFLIAEHLKGNRPLDARFNPLIDKVKTHLDYECKLRKAINPFYSYQYEVTPTIDLQFSRDKFHILTKLYPTFIQWQLLSKEMANHKYALPNSPARDALEADIAEHSRYIYRIDSRSSNSIQLKPTKSSYYEEANARITQADIAARDYLHLRSVPSLQIALTLDYFTRHVAKLANESDQRYVEANLFQPGLLKKALLTPSFLPQFDRFLTTGLRFFSKNGQQTRESLLFLRLDYLVSHYLYCTDKSAGLKRLQAIQDQLIKQLSQPNTPEVTYVQQQYLFLTLMNLIELGDNPGELFALALESYFHIQGHANPLILEDSAHRIEVDKAIAKFQLLASQQPEETIKKAVETV